MNTTTVTTVLMITTTTPIWTSTDARLEKVVKMELEHFETRQKHCGKFQHNSTQYLRISTIDQMQRIDTKQIQKISKI
jgi:hypothetical protein